MELYQMYNPITATPFAHNEHYMEFEPCLELKPFIKCFWGTNKPIQLKKTDIETTGIVTPDTCMDIIFEADFTNNKISDSFCGINTHTFETYSKNDTEKEIFTFAIRFYAWSVVCFSEESMQNVLNEAFDAGYHFEKIKKRMLPLLFQARNMEEMKSMAEGILLSKLNEKHSNRLVLEAVFQMMKKKGNIQMKQLAKEIHTSNRQLERLFKTYVGISPKGMASLIRYQYLWNDILYRPDFQIFDAVCKYGYTDQAHLIHDFKKYHSMSIKEAKEYAVKHVAFLQE